MGKITLEMADGVNEYGVLRRNLQENFTRNVEGNPPLFTTDASGLFNAYLFALPAPDRRYHECHTCRKFLEQYGGLVTIDEEGVIHPVLWEGLEVPGFYREAIEKLATIVAEATVTGVFVTHETAWGQPVNGKPEKVCTHMAVVPPADMVEKIPWMTAASFLENRKHLLVGMSSYRLQHVVHARTLLEAEAIPGGEKVLGQVRWLHDLYQLRGSSRDNLIWRAVAEAPVGFCQFKGQMTGNLLDDIASGMELGDVVRRFAAKVNPTVYRRPTEPPTAQNVEVAEKLVAELGITRSLERRYARLEEIQDAAIWKKPETVAPERSSVFGHLTTKGEVPQAAYDLPLTTITWVKFRDTILGSATQLAFRVPAGDQAYMALVTAVHPESPLIFQWGNPVSWYTYPYGSPAQQWGLQVGTYTEVNAILPLPCHWGGTYAKTPESALFVLDGCMDRRPTGSALFPEIIKSELHKIRSTIEAFSRKEPLKGAEEGSACGIAIRHGGKHPIRVMVDLKGLRREFLIDRWD